VVNLSFQQRRKTLKNCLTLFADHLPAAENIIDLTQRPQQLSAQQFVQLANAINHSMSAAT
jgi:16S rRNA A1518/A1519 N6-dimethyltransferase RsmA/KsgA/DIM1 with predicted DNA glycosylase/AP lyase activity